MSSFRLPSLYPIVNVAGGEAAERGRVLALAVELAEAGCPLVQLRAKTLGAGAMTSLASRLVEALRDSGTQLIVNDRADVAAASGAAGVHLGDEDLPVVAARGVLPSPSIVGYSTHSVAEAAAADSSGADYLGFGPVFESPTKAGVREARGLDLLAQACRATTLPVVAIGGVTLEGARACWEAGAASVAVISEIERSADRKDLVARFGALHASISQRLRQETRVHLELHDSDARFHSRGTDLVLELRPAFIHHWEKSTTGWKGEGRIQNVDITIANGRLEPWPGDGEFEISDGEFEVDGTAYRNLVPLSFERQRSIRGWLELINADKAFVSGSGIVIRAIGEWEYVEELPSEFAPDDNDRS